nr:DUF6508 domain-containing protein [Actinoallomurus bryophytorum]
MAVAGEFAALPQADGDFHWTPTTERPDGVITVGYPVYGERVQRARRALVDVGAVTPAYPWMDQYPLTVPDDGVLPPADAIRIATATVRGERFCDGTIGQALEQGTLQAVLTSLSTWYRTRATGG